MPKRTRTLEQQRRYNHQYHQKLKAECFAHYGGAHCFIEGCEEDTLDNMELHHPDGGGNEDRAEKIGSGLRSPGGWHFYLALKKLGYPPGFVVICIHHHDVLHGRLEEGYKDIVPF
jgi:hypothetical protein